MKGKLLICAMRSFLVTSALLHQGMSAASAQLQTWLKAAPWWMETGQWWTKTSPLSAWLSLSWSTSPWSWQAKGPTNLKFSCGECPRVWKHRAVGPFWVCCPFARQQPWFLQITVLLSMSSYLLHIFMEAGCLDWCVVIGLILRESSVVSQILGIAQSSEMDGEMLQNIKAGLHAVDRWASTDWWVLASISMVSFGERRPFHIITIRYASTSLKPQPLAEAGRSLLVWGKPNLNSS